MAFETVDRLMANAVNERVFPGAVLRVSCCQSVVFENAYGTRDLNSGSPVAADTVYDLASLTKALSTAPAFMVLVQNGSVSLESSLASLLPEFARGEKRHITVGQLLTHTSGLPDYRPYYIALADLPFHQRGNALKRMLISEPLVNPVGTRTLYSDIGYMILAWIVERISGMSLPSFVGHSVYEPLGINELFYIGDDNHRMDGPVYAATEDCPWRKKILNGEVHDDNAWIMGGGCGHAGLFGTARGVDQLLGEYLDVYHGLISSRVFEQRVLRHFLSECGDTRRTPGFDMPSREGSSSGSCFSTSSVGHLGFTGTSFWMDLEKKVRVILLSNRVHPSRDNMKIRTLRPLIHDAVMVQLKKGHLF